MALEGVFEVPRQVLEDNIGFALDAGGTMIKILYRAKKDAIFNNDINQTCVRLRTTQISNIEKDKVVTFLKEHCDIQASHPILWMTGMCANSCRGLMEETFMAKCIIQNEMKCFVRALHQQLITKQSQSLDEQRPASTLGSRDILGTDSQPKPTQDHIELFPTTGLTTEQVYHSSSGTRADPGKLSTHNTPALQYPYLLGSMGSRFGITLVLNSNKLQLLDGMPSGGRTFLALCELAFGTSNYNELIDKAERGKPSDANSLIDTKSTTEEACHDDAVRGLLEMICCDLCKCGWYFAANLKVPRVLFCGNFMSRPLVRSIMEKHMESQNRTMKSTGFQANIQFVQDGGYFGALGAILKD